MFKLYGILDNVSDLYKSIFVSQEFESDAIRSFVGAMYGQNDISFFSNDFDLYFLGTIDDCGEITVAEKQKLLITGRKAKRLAKANPNLAEAFGSVDEEATEQKAEE